MCVSVSVYVRVGRGRGLALEGNNSDSLRFSNVQQLQLCL